MKFVKEDNEERRDYILQKDETTKTVSGFVIVMLAILVIAVIVSGIYFIKF